MIASKKVKWKNFEAQFIANKLLNDEIEDKNIIQNKNSTRDHSS